MNLIPGFNWLSVMAQRHRQKTVPAAPDPADMGTAFGLDASMAPSLQKDTPPRPEAAERPAMEERLARRPQR
jgi:hypothetical protein